MVHNLIIIRKANMKDVDDIQRLLLSDYRNLSTTEIVNSLDRLYLLFCGRKLLGVTCMESNIKKQGKWTSVHPMFRYSLIETGMGQLLKGVSTLMDY